MKVGVSKAPKWESELWSYLTKGNGERCPLFSHCYVRQRNGWCPGDNAESINRLLDERRFNFSSYDFIRYGTCTGLCKMVEMLAQRWLKRTGACGPPVLTELVAHFVEQHSIEVRLLPLKAYHGAIWYVGGRWIIHLKESDTIARRRFTLFHEVFHILAHDNKTTPVFKKRGTAKGSFNELLADCFAAYILMPREWVEEKWADVKDLDKMAEIFIVPKPAMCIRLRRLGLI